VQAIAERRLLQLERLVIDRERLAGE
jgi:hypothetical protein